MGKIQNILCYFEFSRSGFPSSQKKEWEFQKIFIEPGTLLVTYRIGAFTPPVLISTPLLGKYEYSATFIL